MLGGRDVLLVRVIHFLVIIIILAGHGYNPLRASLLPLLATHRVLLGTMDGNVGWRRSAIARDRFPAAWDREMPSRLLISGVMGSDAEQPLSGVPDGIVRCPEVRRLLLDVHGTPRHLLPRSLRNIAMPILVAVSTLAWVPHMVFELHAHMPLASLTARLGFLMLPLLPWRALG
jgi:hypothetical protein